MVYILNDDIFGQSFVALLIEALQRGVKVKVMLDGRGSLLTSRGRLMRALRAAGAEAVSKLLTGGSNVGEEYFLVTNESKKKVFKDADIYAEFDRPFIPGISAFNAEFYSEHAFDVNSRNSKGTEATRKSCMQSLHALEDRMKNDILSPETLSTHPDIALTERLKEALIEAANNGAEIIFNTTSPMSTDNKMTQANFIYNWKKILKTIPNSKIFATKGTDILHAKLFVFDHKKAIVGGYNLDKLSEKHNSEFRFKVNHKNTASPRT